MAILAIRNITSWGQLRSFIRENSYQHRDGRIGYHTYARYAPEHGEGAFAIRHWDTDIYVLRPNHIATLDVGGHHTQTTRNRLNQLLPANMSVTTANGQWIVSNGTAEAVSFENGVRVDVANGHLVPNPANPERWAFVAAVRRLRRSYRDDNTELRRLWEEAGQQRQRLLDILSHRDTTLLCFSCEEPMWLSRSYATVREDHICIECTRGTDWASCGRCGLYSEGAFTEVVDGTEVCDDCLDGYSWCDDCERYEPTDYRHRRSACKCVAKIPDFLFPANGGGHVKSDRRLTVTIANEQVGDVGIEAIARMVHQRIIESGDPRYNDAGQDIALMCYRAVKREDQRWQTHDGNLPKRIAKAIHKLGLNYKLPDGVISEIGNVARQYVGKELTHHIEFTRNINLPAANFAHADSCWWYTSGSINPDTNLPYAISRCTLKDIGGLGIRSFIDESSSLVIGRAWILPLDVNLEPTHDTILAHAYLVFNCYGDLSEYKAARVVAYLTDRIYKKIKPLIIYPMYINRREGSDAPEDAPRGFLIADPATCENVSSLNLNHYWVHPPQEQRRAT